MNNNIVKALAIVAAIFLIIGCFKLPIGYYTFLRIVICIVSVILLFFPKNGNISWHHIINGLVAIMFNPIIPIYLHSKTTWMVIDMVAAVWFIIQAITIISNKNHEKK